MQQGKDIDGEAADDEFGLSVSLNSDGSIVAIGSQRNDGIGKDAGHTRVYKLTSGNWVQLGKDIDGDTINDYSGTSVSLSADGSILAIGAPYNDGNGTNSGHVRVFKFNSGNWLQVGDDIDGESAYEESGSAISLSADGLNVAIGAPKNNDNGVSSGQVRIYKLISGVWTQVGGDINGSAITDRFGFSVSLNSDGSVVAIGSPFNYNNGNGNSGHVKVFKLVSGVWTQLGGDIEGDNESDHLGWSTSISSDGKTVAVGANYFSFSSGTDTGYVKVYNLVSGKWVQKEQKIVGESSYDQFGHSVSLSSSGSTVAIGSAYSGTNNSTIGHVSIFQSCKTSSSNIKLEKCNSYTVPSGDESYFENGIYFDTIKNSNNCDSIIKINLTIHKLDVSISKNSSTLTANTVNASYNWLDCNKNFSVIPGETNQSFSPKTDGSYSVEIIKNNCIDTSICITVNNVGILEGHFENTLICYPNPTKNIINILSKNEEVKEVFVYDIFGQLIELKKNYLNVGHIKIDFYNQPNGIYFVHITNPTKTYIEKIVLQKE